MQNSRPVVAITGSSGFLGGRLSAWFTTNGWNVKPVTRGDLALPPGELASLLEGSKLIINLAGAPLLQRWTPRARRVIMESRTHTTARIVDAIHTMEAKPEALLSSSAVGIYPSDGNHTETSQERDPGFLGQICTAWESEALKARGDCRVVILRTGVILDPKAGALKKMLPVFRLGLGGVLGSGKQAFSWMHITDYIQAVDFILEDGERDGPYNLTAPGIVTNKEFTRTLASVLHRPAWARVPAFALKIMFGRAAETMLEGPAAIPGRLQEEGYEFAFPHLAEALQDLVGR